MHALSPTHLDHIKHHTGTVLSRMLSPREQHALTNFAHQHGLVQYDDTGAVAVEDSDSVGVNKLVTARTGMRALVHSFFSLRTVHLYAHEEEEEEVEEVGELDHNHQSANRSKLSVHMNMNSKASEVAVSALCLLRYHLITRRTCGQLSCKQRFFAHWTHHFHPRSVAEHDRIRLRRQQVSLSLNLSLRLKGLYFYTVGVLCNVDWCIRQLWCSSIISYNTTSI